MTTSAPPLWRRERLGLSMIAASLVAISAIVWLLFSYLHEARQERIRAQGTSLTRVLAAMPLSELVPSSNPVAVLSALTVNENKEDFAYASVVGPDGLALAEVAAPGVFVPPVAIPAHPSGWLGERKLESGGNGARVHEYHAPLLVDGELGAWLRLGYFEPATGFTPQQLPFVATLALIIFLLVPAFYFLMRREIRPLQTASASLHELVQEGQLRPVELRATGELSNFMGRFNAFVEFANRRIAELEADRERTVSSTKLLSYRKQRMLRVLESLPDAILVVDEAGRAKFANRHFQDLLDVDITAVSDTVAFEWCAQPQVRDFLGQLSSPGHLLPEPVEFSLDAAPGKTYQSTAYPLFAPDDGKSIGCLVTIRDVTMEILARNSRAEFVAHVAHELKTPLTVLSMYSESLQNEGDEEALRIEAANVIHDEVGRLSVLINNLLSVTKIEMGSMDIERVRVRLQDLVQDAFDSARRSRTGSDIEFECDVPADIAPLKLDKDLLRIALNNLLTNAVKYNRPGGKVSLCVEDAEDVVRIKVSDTGIGIEPADLPMVFDKFYRSDSDDVRERSGHGLGLALARDIVELHSGSIHVESTPGVGTTFSIELWKYKHSMKQVI